MIERIPDLTYNGLVMANGMFPWYNPFDDTTYRANFSDIIAGLTDPGDAWNEFAVYAIGDIVSYGGGVWISTANGNEGNPPGPASAFWDEEPDPGPPVGDYWPLSGLGNFSGDVNINPQSFNFTLLGNDAGTQYELYVQKDYVAMNLLNEDVTGNSYAIGLGGGFLQLNSFIQTEDMSANFQLGHATLPTSDWTVTDILTGSITNIAFGKNSIVISDDGLGATLFPGMQYGSDFSLDFTSLSIPHVQWVLDQIAGGGSGWPLAGSATFTNDVDIDTDVYQFVLHGADGLGAESSFEFTPTGLDLRTSIDSLDYFTAITTDGQSVNLESNDTINLLTAQLRVENGSGTDAVGLYGISDDQALTKQSFFSIYGGNDFAIGAEDAVSTFGAKLIGTPNNVRMSATDGTTPLETYHEVDISAIRGFVDDGTVKAFSTVVAGSVSFRAEDSAGVSNYSLFSIGQSDISFFTEDTPGTTHSSLTMSNSTGIQLDVNDVNTTTLVMNAIGLSLSNQSALFEVNGDDDAITLQATVINFAALSAAAIGADTPTETVILQIGGVDYKFFVTPA